MCSGSAAGQRAFNTEGNPHSPLSGELHGFVIGFFEEFVLRVGFVIYFSDRGYDSCFR